MTDELADVIAAALAQWDDLAYAHNCANPPGPYPWEQPDFVATAVRWWLDKGPLRDWADSDAAAMAASHDDVRVSRQRVREYMQRAIVARRREAGLDGGTP